MKTLAKLDVMQVAGGAATAAAGLPSDADPAPEPFALGEPHPSWTLVPLPSYPVCPMADLF